MSIVILKDFSEVEFASTNTKYRWPIMDWIAANCGEWFECPEEEVALVENDDGEEIVTVAGIPSARLVYRDRNLPWCKP